MDIQAIKSTIDNGNAVLGIEMGSTRIKAVLIDEKHNPIASGSHGWENRFENGVWTYHLDDVWAGLQDAYKNHLLPFYVLYPILLFRANWCYLHI